MNVRLYRWLLVIVVAYACFQPLFFLVTDRYGLIAPTGVPNLAIAMLGIIFIVLRLIVLFGVPFVLAYRVSARLYERFSRTEGRAPYLRNDRAE
jgi:hypothetical protein